MFLSKKFNGIFYLYYKDITGRRVSVSTHSRRKTEALKFLSKFKPGSLQKPGDFPQTCTLKELSEKVLLSVSKSQSVKSFKSYRIVFNHLLRIIGNYPVSEFSANDIEQYKNKRLGEASRATVNVELARIKAVFQRAVDWNLTPKNPGYKVKRVKIEQKEILSMSHDEVKKVIDVIDNSLIKSIVLFALHTGCRLNEILNLEWQDINLNEKTLHIRNKPGFTTKSGKIRLIPISDNLFSLLYDIYSTKSQSNIYELKQAPDYLFKNVNGGRYDKSYISHKFKHYLRLAGLPEKYHMHCLRHTFITNLVKLGVNANYIKEIAGHASLSTTQNYIHITSNDLRQAMDMVKF